MMYGITLEKINELAESINKDVKQPENIVEWNYPKLGLIIDRKGNMWGIVKISGKKNVIVYVKPHLVNKGHDKSIRRVNKDFRSSVWYYLKREYALLGLLKTRYDSQKSRQESI
jgi:hypothetical protein